MRNRILNAVCLALVLLVGGTTASAEPTETVRIPADDGVELSTDIYRPEAGKAPVILARTPYGSGQLAFLAEGLVRHGYAVAIQDVRGRYGSGGEHEPFRPHERSDGLATLKWLAAQEWCDGRIGMWGSSYSGYAALVLADVELDALRSIFSISGWIDAEEIVKPGGAMHLQLDLPWMLTQQGRLQRSLGEFDVDRLFRHTPLREAMRAAGLRNETWEDPSWLDAPGRIASVGEVSRPVFHVTGWHDMVYRATLKAYRDIALRTSQPQKLAVGPWYHNQMLFGTFEIGDAHFGEASGFGIDEMIALAVRWFDATVKGRKNGILSEPPVSYFVMGHNAWQRETSWPPAGERVEQVRWYLDSAGSANSLDGDGELSTSAPSGAAADRFVFDPTDPVPTLGGAIFFYFPDLLGVKDQREIERRHDVLVYTSAPLKTELQITGNVTARLHAATTGRDTDFTAKLVVVRPDGYARLVEDGIVRLSGALKAVPPPGEPVELAVDLGHTAIAVPAGHRLRVEISSSNFPKYDRNPNTGEDPFLATEFAKVEQTIFHSAERASYIRLPVRTRPLKVTRAARRPLVPPVESQGAGVAAVEGTDAAELLATGRRQMEDDEVDQAIATLRRAAELNPDGSSEQLWLGRAYLAKLNSVSMFKKLGLSKKVRAHYTKAVELDPKNVGARSSLASYYFNAPGIAGGSFEKGREQAELIAKSDPKTAHRLMAGAYRDKDENDKALREYRAIIALDPKDKWAYYGIGVLHQQAEAWVEAFDAFEQGVKQVDDMASLYQIGRTAVFSGERLERGLQALQQYIERAPEGPGLPSVASARWRLGMIHERRGRKDLARKEYEAALKLEPEMEQARESLKSLAE